MVALLKNNSEMASKLEQRIRAGLGIDHQEEVKKEEQAKQPAKAKR